MCKCVVVIVFKFLLDFQFGFDVMKMNLKMIRFVIVSECITKKTVFQDVLIYQVFKSKRYYFENKKWLHLSQKTIKKYIFLLEILVLVKTCKGEDIFFLVVFRLINYFKFVGFVTFLRNKFNSIVSFVNFV